MILPVVWPLPIRNKLYGLNLPFEVEEAFVRGVESRILDCAGAPFREGVCFEGVVAGYDFWAWAAFEKNKRHCFITDCNCFLL